jgi:hypothetical protein
MAMSLADTLSIVAIIVSVGTLLATLYEQYWKRPNLSLVLGESAFISYAPNLKRVVLWACVVLANRGAEDAAILRVEGTLSTAAASEYEIVWVALGKYHDEEAHDEKSLKPLLALEFKSSLIFSDWAEALVSSSRKASASWIAFSGEKLSEISPGSYNLQLRVITDNGQRGLLTTISGSAGNGVACSWNGSLEIPDDKSNKLKEALETQKGAPSIYSVSLQGRKSGVRPKSPTATLGYSPGQL